MSERLVDVLDSEKGTVLHTYPVKIAKEGEIPEEEFHDKAAKAAKFSKLVSGEDSSTLTTRMHVSRGGPLKPYGDQLSLKAETKESIERDIAERAYFLSEKEGHPEGRQQEFWDRAQQEHLQERAYTLWEQEGFPEDQAEAIWIATVEYERDILA